MSTITPQVAVDTPTTLPVGPCGILPTELDTIIKAASQLFGTPAVAELEEDPEIDERYYLLKMKVSQTVDEVAQLRLRWFDLLYRLAPQHCHAIRLSVSYAP